MSTSYKAGRCCVRAPGLLSRLAAWLLAAGLAAAAPAVPAAVVDDATAEAHGLTATSAQRLAAVVDSAVAMATASEQLAATCHSLTDAHAHALAGDDAGEGSVLGEELRTLGRINERLRALLQSLRDELAGLFTTGQSSELRTVLDQLAALPGLEEHTLSTVARQVPTWTQFCRAPAAKARYQHFEGLRVEHDGLELELRHLGEAVHALRERRATADGRLAGLEEREGRQRGRRSGEEYELARYLGSSLFRWELLRTKVAHHLAHAFTVARDDALHGKSGGVGWDVAQKQLGNLEEELVQVAGAHKKLAERRTSLAKRVRAFLKSLLLSCVEAASPVGDGLEGAMSERFQVLRSKRLGVNIQAAEELVRFLNSTFQHALPQTVALVEEVIAPYGTVTGRSRGGTAMNYVLPTTWKARPKIGRWWEWLEDHGGHAGERPLGSEEFERRFAAAKRRFSVRVSAAEPIVMAYLLWLLLEEALGAALQGKSEEVLSLPSPADVAGKADSNPNATLFIGVSSKGLDAGGRANAFV